MVNQEVNGNNGLSVEATDVKKVSYSSEGKCTSGGEANRSEQHVNEYLTNHVTSSKR